MKFLKYNTASILLSKNRQIYLHCKHHVSTNGSYFHNNGKKPLLYKTIGDLVDEAAERFPTRNAFIACEENKKLTFHELKKHTDDFAAGLLSIGFQKNDKLAIWGPNTLDWIISFFGAAKVGVTTVLLNPYYEFSDLTYCLKKTRVSGIVTPESFGTQKYFSMINELFPNIKSLSDADLMKQSNTPKCIVSAESRLPGTYRFNDILELINDDHPQNLSAARDEVLPDDCLCIQFSSGSTGEPKAAALSHYNYINNSYFLTDRLELNEKQHTICLQTPFFHVFATDVIMCPALYSGSTVVIPSKMYNPLKSLKTIEAERCTQINGTPTMFVDLIKLQQEHKLDMSSLESTICGGSPCPPILYKEMFTHLKVKTVKFGYGMTEAAGVLFFSLPKEDEFLASETVGYLADHFEAKVVDGTGKLVPFGTPGELHVRGNLMLEYYGDEEKTRETKGLDGWLKTGDQVILHENGYAQIVGRLKDIIIRGGENIYPREIEDFLNTHPKIIESQVFGVPDPRMGEEIMACLRVSENEVITLYDIKKFTTGKLAKFKIPKYVRIVKDFPRTGTGKIQKLQLKDSILKELDNSSQT